VLSVGRSEATGEFASTWERSEEAADGVQWYGIVDQVQAAALSVFEGAAAGATDGRRPGQFFARPDACAAAEAAVRRTDRDSFSASTGATEGV